MRAAVLLLAVLAIGPVAAAFGGGNYIVFEGAVDDAVTLADLEAIEAARTDEDMVPLGSVETGLITLLPEDIAPLVISAGGPCGYLGTWSEEEQACILDVTIAGHADTDRPRTIFRLHYEAPGGGRELRLEEDISHLWAAP